MCVANRRRWISAFVVALLACIIVPQRSLAEDADRSSQPQIISCIGAENAQTIATCGQGWLESINGYRVLHLKGTPFEMGYQHGALLRQSVRENFDTLLKVKGDATLVELAGLKLKPRNVIQMIMEIQRPFVPQKYTDEMDGLAAGAGLDASEIRVANFIPELFHCSGFAIAGDATVDGTLYHGRVLDYAVDWGLQDHAVIIVAEPEEGIPFVNISYAGFVGSVTGMNTQHVSIGEMGGGGLGNWEGVPMAQLMREVIEKAETLEQAIAVFEDHPRTCQYFYVIADGKSGQSVGIDATWQKVDVIRAGQSHPLLPHAVEHCALLSAGDRYHELVRRVKAGNGSFTAESAIRLMDRPVAMGSNLHNVLFEPASMRFWVANAGTDRTPAAEQPYYAFQLSDLLTRMPDSSATTIAFQPQSADSR
jgi:isopenicillin-N N-acyltransferase like protein